MKKTSVIILVLIIALIAWLAMHRKQKEVKTSTNTETTSTNQNQSTNASTNTQQTSESDDAIVGILKVSDNKSRGNLMIMTDATTVYLTTSRDFSLLIGKQVVATIDGDLNNFTLVDIKPMGQQ
jgi:hypothetical protein